MHFEGLFSSRLIFDHRLFIINLLVLTMDHFSFHLTDKILCWWIKQRKMSELFDPSLLFLFALSALSSCWMSWIICGVASPVKVKRFQFQIYFLLSVTTFLPCLDRAINFYNLSQLVRARSVNVSSGQTCSVFSQFTKTLPILMHSYFEIYTDRPWPGEEPDFCLC